MDPRVDITALKLRLFSTIVYFDSMRIQDNESRNNCGSPARISVRSLLLLGKKSTPLFKVKVF
jgi:hypothetical protein